MIGHLRKSIIGLALSLSVSLAYADPVFWSLNNVTFSDGTTATGSFVFDADTSIYSNVLITTSFAGTIYDTSELSPIPFGVNANGLELIDNFVPGANAGKAVLNLDFLGALSDAGGVVGIDTLFPSFEGACISADCDSGFILREVIAGTVTGVVQQVPEPATLALLGIGLAGLAFRRRRG